ncbi:MAG: hypothetical protein QXX81_07515 [Zestosphaera sp.]
MRCRALLLVLLTATLLRLIPTLLTNEPFSTDVWPLIRLSEELLRNPEFRVLSSPSLEGYHGRWPATLLEAAIYSRLTNLEPELYFRYVGVVITSACLAILVYVTVKRCAGLRSALLSTIVLTSIPSFIIFTSTALKEVHSYPLLTVLIFLLVVGISRSALVLTALTSLALVISHPLSPLMFIAFMCSYIFVAVAKYLGGVGDLPLNLRGPLIFLLILSPVYLTYMTAYGWEGLKYRPGFNDILVLGAFSTALYGWYVLLGHGSVGFSVMPLMLVVITVLATGTNLVFDWSVALYVAPFILLLIPLLVEGGENSPPVLAPILLPITTATLYIVLASPVLMSVLHRVLNYLVIATIVASSLLSRRGRLLHLYVTIVLAVSLLMSVATVASVICCGDSISFYWRYGEGEVLGVRNLVKFFSDGMLCGDVKMQYLVGRDLSVEILCGFRATQGHTRDTPTLLYLDNFRFGYVLSPVDVYKIKSINRLSMSRALIYSNVHVFLLK